MGRLILFVAFFGVIFSIVILRTVWADDLSWRVSSLESKVSNLEWKMRDAERDISNLERTTTNHVWAIRDIQTTLLSMADAIKKLQADVEELQIGNPEGGMSVDILAGRRLGELVAKDCVKARSLYETLSTENPPKALLESFKAASSKCFEEPASDTAK